MLRHVHQRDATARRYWIRTGGAEGQPERPNDWKNRAMKGGLLVQFITGPWPSALDPGIPGRGASRKRTISVIVRPEVRRK